MLEEMEALDEVLEVGKWPEMSSDTPLTTP